MNPAPFVHSALAMTRRLKRRDRCPALLALGCPEVAPLYGPAVRCKPNVNKWRGLVLRICIRPLHGAFVLLAIMDIRAHPISF